MLTSRVDADRLMDDTIKRSYPYLIFMDKEFRDHLCEMLHGLIQFHREQNYPAFIDRHTYIVKLLDETMDTTGCDHVGMIYQFQARQQTYDERISELHTKIREMSKELATIKKAIGEKKKKEDFPVLPEENVVPQEDLPDKRTEPITSAPERKARILAFLETTKSPARISVIAERVGLTPRQVSDSIKTSVKRGDVIAMPLSHLTGTRRVFLYSLPGVQGESTVEESVADETKDLQKKGHDERGPSQKGEVLPVGEEEIGDEDALPEETGNEDALPEERKRSVEKTRILTEFLKNASVPLTTEDVKKQTGLTAADIHNRVYRDPLKKNIRLSSIFAPTKQGNTVTNRKRATYLWVEPGNE